MKQGKQQYVTGTAFILMLILAIISLCIGSFPLSINQILDILFGRIRGTMESRVFFNLRLPRVCMGLIAGCALGLSGGTYQTIFRNPLASPDLTGVASGASFGAACAIVLGAGSAVQIMSGAFVMGLMSLVFVLLLVHSARLEQAGSYILAGIIVSSLADAGLMVLKIMADPEKELAAIEFWTMGSLAGITADKLFSNVLFIVIPLILLLLFWKQALMLSMGDEQARSMGVSPFFWRTLFLVLTTFMIAAVVSVSGVIAFIGLIAPHITYMLLKSRGAGYFFLCAIAGADILLLSDILARSLSSGAELPLSILTVFFAVPVLTILMCRKGRQN